MGIAQPALSQAIVALEKELEVTLFHRTSRRVQLTTAGRLFLGHAEHVLAEMDVLQEQMQEHVKVLRGRVVINTMLFFGETHLPTIIAAFNRLHPRVEIIIQNENAQRSFDRLRAGTTDIAIFNNTDERSRSEFVVTNIDGDQIVVVLPPEHRLVGRARVRFAELENEPFVGYEPGSTTYDMLARLGEQAGFVPQVSVRSGNVLLVRALVAAGVGVTTGSKAFFSSPGPPVVTVPLNPPVLFSITVTTNARSTNPAARRLTKFLLEYLGAAAHS